MQPLAPGVTTALVSGGWAEKPEGRLLSLTVLLLCQSFDFCCWPPLREDTQLGYTDLGHSTGQPFKLLYAAVSLLLQCSVLNF